MKNPPTCDPFETLTTLTAVEKSVQQATKIKSSTGVDGSSSYGHWHWVGRWITSRKKIEVEEKDFLWVPASEAGTVGVAYFPCVRHRFRAGAG
jgi:hypothetical protein